MHTTTNDITSHSVVDTEGSGQWITLIHPLGADLSIWNQVACALAPHWQVLRYDVRGHGGTLGNTFRTIETLADDLLGLLNARNIRQTHLVGLALGGMIAQAFTLAYPERVDHLVLCDTAPAVAEDTKLNLRHRADSVRRNGMEMIVDASLARWLTADFRHHHPEAVEPLAETLRACSPARYADACHAIEAFDVRARLAEIDAPTLIVRGDEEGGPLEATDSLAKAIRQSESLHMPGSHLAAIENPGVFVKALSNFFLKEPHRIDCATP